MAFNRDKAINFIDLLGQKMININDLIEIVKELLEITPSIVGAIIAFLLYRLNKNIRYDNLLSSLGNFHEFFWTEPEYKQVRAWIACDEAYESIRPILEKRQNNNYISMEEYAHLEALDKFFAFLVLYKNIEPEEIKYKKVARRVFDEYWLGCITSDKRPELRAYVCRFYRELRESLPR